MRLSILGKIINLLLPRYCPVCDNRLLGSEEMLCINCLKHLPLTMTWSDPYENEMAKMFWGRIPIERCAALIYYSSHSKTSNAIYQLKYHHRPDIGTYLGRLIGSKGQEVNFFEGIDAIIPIPITKKRQQERGYNQSEEIAKGIQERNADSPSSQMPSGEQPLQKVKPTRSRWQRQENVKHVFQLSDTYHDTDGKHPITNLAGKASTYRR